MAETLFPLDETDETAIAISVNGLELFLSHANTTIYSYRRFPEVNHVYHTGEDDEPHAIFGCPTLIEVLRERNFLEHVMPRPTEWDEQAYKDYQKTLLQGFEEGFDQA